MHHDNYTLFLALLASLPSSPLPSPLPLPSLLPFLPPHQELKARLHQSTRDLARTRSELGKATSQVCEQRSSLERLQIALDKRGEMLKKIKEEVWPIGVQVCCTLAPPLAPPRPLLLALPLHGLACCTQEARWLSSAGIAFRPHFE